MKEEGSFNHLLIVIGCCSAGALRRIFILSHRNRLSLVFLMSKNYLITTLISSLYLVIW